MYLVLILLWLAFLSVYKQQPGGVSGKVADFVERWAFGLSDIHGGVLAVSFLATIAAWAGSTL